MTEGNGFTMEEKQENRADPFPKVDFSSFILSIYSSGLVQLGKVQDPSSGKISRNMDMAKHTIDMMAMLEEKTRGNLNKDEESLVKALLSEIRLAYVEASD